MILTFDLIHIIKNLSHDDVIKWNHFPLYWTFVKGIHRWHKGQRRGALMFFFICAWINDWVKNREAGDLRCHCADYDVIVMPWKYLKICYLVPDWPPINIGPDNELVSQSNKPLPESNLPRYVNHYYVPRPQRFSMNTFYCFPFNDTWGDKLKQHLYHINMNGWDAITPSMP